MVTNISEMLTILVYTYMYAFNYYFPIFVKMYAFNITVVYATRHKTGHIGIYSLLASCDRYYVCMDMLPL